MNAKDLNKETSAARLSDGINDANQEGWLAYRPEHNFNFRTSLNFDKVNVSFNTRYVSQTKAIIMNGDLSKDEFPGDFWVMNLSGRYEMFGGLSLNGAIKNLTNSQYEEMEKYRAPVQSFHFGFEYSY